MKVRFKNTGRLSFKIPGQTRQVFKGDAMDIPDEFMDTLRNEDVLDYDVLGPDGEPLGDDDAAQDESEAFPGVPEGSGPEA